MNTENVWRVGDHILGDVADAIDNAQQMMMAGRTSSVTLPRLMSDLNLILDRYVRRDPPTDHSDPPIVHGEDIRGLLDEDTQ